MALINQTACKSDPNVGKGEVVKKYKNFADIIYGSSPSSRSPDARHARVRLTVCGEVEVEQVEGLRGADAVLVLGEEARFHGGVHFIVVLNLFTDTVTCTTQQ